MNKIILLDMDNTIMDFSGGIVKRYNEIYDRKITGDMITDWSMSEISANHDVTAIWKRKGFFSNLELLNDAAEWVPKIAERYNCYICTHAYSGFYDEKEISIKRHFGNLFDDKIIFTKDKHLVRGRILLDDKIENLRNFSNCGGLSVCYNGAHNDVRESREVNWYANRVDCMEEFYNYLIITL